LYLPLNRNADDAEERGFFLFFIRDYQFNPRAPRFYFSLGFFLLLRFKMLKIRFLKRKTFLLYSPFNRNADDADKR